MLQIYLRIGAMKKLKLSQPYASMVISGTLEAVPNIWGDVKYGEKIFIYADNVDKDFENGLDYNKALHRKVFNEMFLGNIPDSLFNTEDFLRPKIMYMEIQTDNEKDGYPFPCFSYDIGDKIVLNTAYIMSSDTVDMRFILGVINSKVGRFLTKLYVSQLQERQYRMLAQYVTNFPIPKLRQSDMNYIIEAVNHNINNCNSILEDRINRAVCSWYDLNADELEFVERGIF